MSRNCVDDASWLCDMCEGSGLLALQVTGTLLKGYKARFKGAPISSTVNYLKQYVSVSVSLLMQPGGWRLVPVVSCGPLCRLLWNM